MLNYAQVQECSQGCDFLQHVSPEIQPSVYSFLFLYIQLFRP